MQAQRRKQGEGTRHESTSQRLAPFTTTGMMNTDQPPTPHLHEPATMIHRICFTLVVACCLIGTTTHADDAPVRARWRPLFDGRSLEGWSQHSGEARYTVEDGCIVGTSVAATGNSFLCTNQEYGDFLLECWWKVDPDLNSGIQFRSQVFDADTEVPAEAAKTKKIPADRVHGYQCEIDTDPGRNRQWSAGIYDESRRGWLYPGSHGGDGTDFTTQGKDLTNVAGWNHVRIECRGDSIKTWLNGELRSDVQDGLTPAGIIALQVHGIGNDETKVDKQVRWRNIRIREFTAE